MNNNTGQMIPNLRAWDKSENRFKPIVAIYFGEGAVELHKKDGENPEYKKIHEVVLTQYTGIKDINGAKIYEGDIVETQQSNLTSVPHQMVGGVVVYDSEKGMYRVNPMYGSKFHSYTIFIDNVKVVGNIFQNDWSEKCNDKK